MFSKRYVVYREVIEWDSDKAYHGAQFTDEQRRKTAEAIVTDRKGWKLRELPTAHKQEAGDAAK